MYKIGDKAFDKPTRTVVTIAESTSAEMDGKTIKLVRVVGAPVTANYPDGWRHDREISFSKAAMAQG